MPPKDEPTGLLSKVVKFVKNPAASWADADQQEARESTYSKQMLKEMIERKRRNDFVRKREFDMLRKMRRSEVMAGQDPTARPSFFQSSMPSKPDDRATTLKKIDEIEAQMSMQWWKTKHGENQSRAGSSTNFPVSSQIPPEAMLRPGSPVRSRVYTATTPQPLPLAGAVDTPRAGLEADGVRDSIPAPGWKSPEPAMPAPGPGQASGWTPLTRPAAVSAISAVTPATAPHSQPGLSSGFSASKLFAIDVEEFAHDPELEEASIRFANGDEAGAEAGLLEVLAPKGARVDHDETWLTLFDLYRATGQQDRFETAAIEFAGRFARSAPQWFSLPDVVARMQAPASAPVPANQPLAHWTCPATLGKQTIAAMGVALAKATPPCRLSWIKLNIIDEAALEGLTKLFTDWASGPVQLRFIGADNLERILNKSTPSGDQSVNPAWWKLRMEALRVMHRPDEFELVALDYCVTYEVSPPSWEKGRCEYKSLEADGSYVGGHTIVGDVFHDSLSSGMSMSYTDSNRPGLNSQMSNISTVELAGQVLGDATEALGILDDKLKGADVMVISCERLIRIDFSAAGTLLNWASTRQSEGHQVQFVQVHRLVAAFFNVVGISEHARVLARTD